MLKLLFLLLFSSSSLFAQESFEQINLEDIDFDTVEDIQLRKEKILENYLIKKDELRKAKSFAQKIERKDIEKSGIFKAFIKRGTVLFNLDGSQKYILPKDIYARLFRQQTKEGYQYLISKNDEVKYMVKATEAANIEVITDLYRKPHFYQPIEKKREKTFFDEQTSFWLETNLLTSLVLSNVTRDLAGKKDSSFARSFKLEVAPYFDFDLPVYLGASLQWETITMSAEGGNARQEILTLGPALQTKYFELFKTPFKFVSSLRFSLYGHLNNKQNDQSENIKIHSTAWQIGLVKEKVFTVGNLTYGIHYQREWIRAKASQVSLDIQSQNTSNDMLGFSLGWSFL